MRAAVIVLLLAASARGGDPFLALPGAPKASSFADVGEVTAAFDPPAVAPGGSATLRITVKPQPGCYTYPLSRGGPGAQNVVRLPQDSPLEIVGEVENPANFHDAPDPNNPLRTVRHYEEAVTFAVPVSVRADAAPGKQEISLSGTRIQVCNDTNCFPSDRSSLPKPTLDILAPAGGAAPVKAAAQPPAPRPAPAPADAGSAAHAAKLDAIVGRLTNDSAASAAAQGGFAGLIAAAIFWGFVSLATPCVFPMIPITVSLFLKQANQSTGTVLKLAAIYSLTIVVVLGSAAVLLLTTFQALSVNEWMNLFLGALFVFFALSLFGAYEVTLPKVVTLLVGFGWLFVIYHAVRLMYGVNLLDTSLPALKLGVGAVLLTALTYFQLSGRGAALESQLLQSTERGRKAGGFIGTVAGAMAFSIVSFTCVAPFLGGFAGVLQGSGNSRLELVLAGLAFAAAFASPFFVLALFPSLVKKLPKSGGWMDTVKAVMGFLELAAAFKFFRTAEQKVTGSAEFFHLRIMPRGVGCDLGRGGVIPVALLPPAARLRGESAGRRRATHFGAVVFEPGRVPRAGAGRDSPRGRRLRLGECVPAARPRRARRERPGVEPRLAGRPRRGQGQAERPRLPGFYRRDLHELQVQREQRLPAPRGGRVAETVQFGATVCGHTPRRVGQL